MRRCEERLAGACAPRLPCSFLLVLLLLACASSWALAEGPARPRTRRDVAVGDAGDILGQPAACRTEDTAGDFMGCAGVQRSLLQNQMKRSQQVDVGSPANREEISPAVVPTLERAKRKMELPVEGVEIIPEEEMRREGDKEQRQPGMKEPAAALGDPRAELALDVGARFTPASGAQRVLAWVEPVWHRAAGGALILQRHVAGLSPVSPGAFLQPTCLVVVVALCLAIFRRSRARTVQNGIDKTRPIELTPSVSKLPPPKSSFQNLPSAFMYKTCGSAMTPRAHPFNNRMLPPQPRAPYSTRMYEQLCPELVVPQGYECLLAVRQLAGRTHEHVVLDILDMHGKPVLKADIAALSACNLQSAPLDSRPPLLTLRTPSVGAPLDATGSPGAVLSVCKMASVTDLHHHHEVCRLARSAMRADDHGQQVGGELTCGGSELGTSIYNAAGELFGVLTLDLTHPRYVFVGRGVIRSHMRLFFGMDFSSFPTVVTNEHGEHLADTEPTTAPFDAEGKFYRAKVNPGTDVCLVLSGLIAIDAMEAQLAAQ